MKRYYYKWFESDGVTNHITEDKATAHNSAYYANSSYLIIVSVNGRSNFGFVVDTITPVMLDTSNLIDGGFHNHCL